MIDIMEVRIHAEGDYSGKTHDEVVFVTKEFYERHKEEIDEIDIYIGELDGKHSEVQSDLSVDEIDTENTYDWSNDKDFLDREMQGMFGDEYIADYQKCLDELRKIDKKTTVNYTIRESQVAALNDIVDMLDNGTLDIVFEIHSNKTVQVIESSTLDEAKRQAAFSKDVFGEDSKIFIERVIRLRKKAEE